MALVKLGDWLFVDGVTRRLVGCDTFLNSEGQSVTLSAHVMEFEPLPEEPVWVPTIGQEVEIDGRPYLVRSIRSNWALVPKDGKTFVRDEPRGFVHTVTIFAMEPLAAMAEEAHLKNQREMISRHVEAMRRGEAT